MILYINNEHCFSLEQLKSYFSENLTSISDTYYDLLDYGRHGDIAVWLRELDEHELATRVEAISSDLSDSAYFAQLKAVVTDMDVVDFVSLKPTFDKCFTFEGVECDDIDKEAKISVRLKVVMCVNEEYEVCVSCNWGTRAVMLNPYDFSEGKTATIDFILRKKPGKAIGEISIRIDGKELLYKDTINSTNRIFTVNTVNFKMIKVSPGSYIRKKKWNSYISDYDRERVIITKEFYIAEFPVTKKLWNEVMSVETTNIYKINEPVDCVSWDDCKCFIEKINQITGECFRLPTEAEWEFAAKGGNKSLGYNYPGSDNLFDVANFGGREVVPVGMKQANELGVFDMYGNVWEWCQDWYDQSNRYTLEVIDPKGADNGYYKVLKGGGLEQNNVCGEEFSFKLPPSYRVRPRKAYKIYDIGFRLCL